MKILIENSWFQSLGSCFKMEHIEHDAFSSVEPVGTKAVGSPFIITVPLVSLYSANGVSPDPASFVPRNPQKDFPSHKLSSLSLTCHGWNGWSGAKHWFLPCFASGTHWPLIAPLYDRDWLMPSFSHKGPTFCLQSLKTDELAPKPAPPHRTATGKCLSQFVCCPGRDIALAQRSSQQCVFNHMRVLSIFPVWSVAGENISAFLLPQCIISNIMHSWVFL